MNNQPLFINTDFARQVVFVSSQLDVSERYVASLMQSIISKHPNLTFHLQQEPSASERLVESTIAEFHARRRQLAECLKYIVEAAVLGQHESGDFAVGTNGLAGGVPEVYRQLELFVRQEILAQSSASTSAARPGFLAGLAGGSLSHRSETGGFPLRLLKEIDGLGETIEKVRVSHQNAKSDTFGPSQTQGKIFFKCILTVLTSVATWNRRGLGGGYSFSPTTFPSLGTQDSRERTCWPM